MSPISFTCFMSHLCLSSLTFSIWFSLYLSLSFSLFLCVCWMLIVALGAERRVLKASLKWPLLDITYSNATHIQSHTNGRLLIKTHASFPCAFLKSWIVLCCVEQDYNSIKRLRHWHKLPPTCIQKTGQDAFSLVSHMSMQTYTQLAFILLLSYDALGNFPKLLKPIQVNVRLRACAVSLKMRLFPLIVGKVDFLDMEGFHQ